MPEQLQSVFETYLLPRPNPTPNKTNIPNYLRFDHDDSSVYATPPEIPNTRRRPKPCEKFQFSHIFPDDSTLQNVFQATAAPLVERLLQGKDGLLFTFGVTGSGKTHTIFGEPSNPGIIPLSLKGLFEAIQEHQASRADFDCMPPDSIDKNGIVIHAKDFIPPSTTDLKTRARRIFTFPTLLENTTQYVPTATRGQKYAICLSFYELYQDRIYDLLDDTPTLMQKRKHLQLKRDIPSGRRYVSQLRKIYVATPEEAFFILNKGMNARQSNETALNSHSSRSHAVVALELKTWSGDGVVKSAVVNFVDLAGSERCKGTMSGGERLAEAGSINRSLMVLGQCIEVLRNQRKTNPNTNTHNTGSASSSTSTIGDVGKSVGIIPFRQNKLTELLFGNAILKNAGRETRAVMIVNLALTTAYEENVGVLRYASLAHEIEALPASELGGSLGSATGSMSRSASGETRIEEVEWNERLGQLEFLLHEEECKRLDAEQRYTMLEQEMIQQSLEMDEKMAEMEKMYMYRILEVNQRSYDHVDAKLEIMASSMDKFSIKEDPVLEQKEQLIRDLQDENLSLRQELESLRVGFRDEPKTPLAERKNRYNVPGSVRSVSKKKLRSVKSIFDLNVDSPTAKKDVDDIF